MLGLVFRTFSERFLLMFFSFLGQVWESDNVILQRQPDNEYDSNAILVLNNNRAKIGHLKRQAAALISPIIDGQLCCMNM